jgi:hypothetical protein
MTDLSPAAQAVLDAASDVYWDWSDMFPAASHVIAAATLRAATIPLTSRKAIDQLHAIAAELEALSND